MSQSRHKLATKGCSELKGAPTVCGFWALTSLLSSIWQIAAISSCALLFLSWGTLEARTQHTEFVMFVISVSLLARTHLRQPEIPAASSSGDSEKCSHHAHSSRWRAYPPNRLVVEPASGCGISTVGINLQASGDSNPDIALRGKGYAGRQNHYQKLVSKNQTETEPIVLYSSVLHGR